MSLGVKGKLLSLDKYRARKTFSIRNGGVPVMRWDIVRVGPVARQRPRVRSWWRW